MCVCMSNNKYDRQNVIKANVVCMVRLMSNVSAEMVRQWKFNFNSKEKQFNKKQMNMYWKMHFKMIYDEWCQCFCEKFISQRKWYEFSPQIHINMWFTVQKKQNKNDLFRMIFFFKLRIIFVLIQNEALDWKKCKYRLCPLHGGGVLLCNNISLFKLWKIIVIIQVPSEKINERCVWKFTFETIFAWRYCAIPLYVHVLLLKVLLKWFCFKYTTMEGFAVSHSCCFFSSLYGKHKIWKHWIGLSFFYCIFNTDTHFCCFSLKWINK